MRKGVGFGHACRPVALAVDAMVVQDSWVSLPPGYVLEVNGIRTHSSHSLVFVNLLPVCA